MCYKGRVSASHFVLFPKKIFIISITFIFRELGRMGSSAAAMARLN
jgi:hypothetical protein